MTKLERFRNAAAYLAKRRPGQFQLKGTSLGAQVWVQFLERSVTGIGWVAVDNIITARGTR